MSDKIKTTNVYTVRPGYFVNLAVNNGPVEPKPIQYGNDKAVGRNLDGIPQPYVGVIVMLQHLAEFGMVAFHEDGTATPNRENCLRMAQELIDAQKKLWEKQS